jgi:hypothetical protein
MCSPALSVRSLSNTIRPFSPGNAASARGVADAWSPTNMNASSAPAAGIRDPFDRIAKRLRPQYEEVVRD